jgi:hypothetical protein
MVDTASTRVLRAGTRSPWTAFLALALTLASIPGFLLAWLFAGLTCDEGCSDQPTTWTSDPNAWQWKGQWALAGVATALAIYALFSRRSPNSAIAVALSVGVWLVWLAFGFLG